MKKIIFILLLLILAFGCFNSKVILKINHSNSIAIKAVQLDAIPTPRPVPKSIPVFTPKIQPAGTISIIENKINKGTENIEPFVKININVTFPSSNSSLSTKSLITSDITYKKVEITGLGITGTIYANGTTGPDYFLAQPGENLTATATVPVGNSRVISVTAYDAGKNEIPGTKIKGVFNTTGTFPYEISWKTTPTGKVIENLFAGTTRDKWLASKLNLTDLQTLIKNITGTTGTYPNYLYTTHPAFVDADKIKTDLIANDGNITALDNPSYYSTVKITPATVTGTITGLVWTDKTTITVTDPASQISNNNGNGVFSITGVAPTEPTKEWKVKIENAGYITSSIPEIEITAGEAKDIGTITLTPPTPSISNLNPTVEVIGQPILINGTNFHSAPQGNVVKFGTTTATVSVASPTQLTVTVPDGIFKTQIVTITIGTQLSNNDKIFTVKPLITGIGKNTINGDTIYGTGFSPTFDNTATYNPAGGTTILNVTNTQIDLDTTQLPFTPFTLTGNQTLTVTTGTQTSSPYNIDFGKPLISLLNPSSEFIGNSIQINGDNFSDGNPLNYTVKFGTQTANVTGVTVPNQLTVTVPTNIYENVNVTVTLAGQTSNTSNFKVKPSITSITPNNAVIGTTNIQIDGSGFSPTLLNNIVKFNGVDATVTSANTTQLKVTVPNAPSGNVTVTVNGETSNGMAFNVKPTVSITSPLPSSIINGNASPVSANVTSGNPVTDVKFYYDAVAAPNLIDTDNSAPYSVNFDTTTVASGAHTLIAVVTDSYPNAEQSTPINITINQPPNIATLTASPSPISGIGYPTELTCNVTDVDNVLNVGSFTWSATGPGGAGSFGSTTYSAPNAKVTWTSPSSGSGIYTIKVQVSDGINSAVEKTVDVTVNSGSANTIFNPGGFY